MAGGPMRPGIGRTAAAAVAVVVILVAAFARGEATRDVRIAVLISQKGAPFGETVSGFHRHLAGEGFRVRYVTHHLEGSEAKAARAAAEIRRDRPDLVLALGTLAADAAVREIPDIPVVTGIVLRSDGARRSSNATGVFLEFPYETQFRWLRRFLPDARTVGVLYNPAENRERIETAGRAAAALGLRLEMREVKTPRDLPEALESLAKKSDVLWGLYDTVALTPETARHILLFSFRYRIPFVGLSASWVKAGALYALEWDYADIGTQCGEAALKVLRGIPAGTIAPAPPRKTAYALNLNTARQMRIDLPEALVRGAQLAY